MWLELQSCDMSYSVKNRERSKKDGFGTTTNGTYPCSSVTQTFRSDSPSRHDGDLDTFDMITSTYQIGLRDSVASLLAATLYQSNTDRKHKFWNILSTEGLHVRVLLEYCCI